MKILLIHTSYQKHGGEDVAFEQESLLLQRAGHDVMIYRRSNSEAEAYSGVRRLQLAKEIVWAGAARRNVTELLRKYKPDVAHIHNTFMMISPSVHWACRKANVPVVQTLHNYRLFCLGANFFRNNQPCEDCARHGEWLGVRYKCYRESRAASAPVAVMLAVHRNLGTWTQAVTRFIALTNFARQRFVAAGLPPSKIAVKPNFVSMDPGQKKAGGEYAIFVGRLSAEKGVRVLVSAWSQLHSSVPLIIVGEGPLQQEIQSRLSRCQRVTFRGWLPHQETLAAIKAARFLVLPSECYENFPMTIAEAFACGVPVICSRLGAMKEIVNDNCTGLHFTAGDSEDLAAKVEWAWAHPHDMEAMGRATRAEYQAKYTAQRNYEMLIDIYTGAIRSTRQGIP